MQFYNFSSFLSKGFESSYYGTASFWNKNMYMFTQSYETQENFNRKFVPWLIW